jgi:hypothetical protein
VLELCIYEENYEDTRTFRYSCEYFEILFSSISLIHEQESININTVHVSLNIDF